jgi:glycosyltransferase involved in cell wall biosynthesis
VSVIVPTYNRPRLVGRAVRSVLDQTYTDLECIVVDSASETPATEALSSITDDRLTVVRLSEDRGRQHARNVAIERATGEYVAFLDDDDVWLSEKLAHQVHWIERKGRDGCVTFKRIVDEDGTIEQDEGYISEFRVLLGDVKTQPMSTLVVRRDCVEVVGGFDTDFPFQHEDREFCLRLLDQADLGVLKKPLIEVHREGRAEFPEPRVLARGKQALLIKHRWRVQRYDRRDRWKILNYNLLELGMSLGYHGHTVAWAWTFLWALWPPVLSPSHYAFCLAVVARRWIDDVR